MSIKFSSQLRDMIQPTSNWILLGADFAENCSQFYAERAELEKEYGAKLTALAKKYMERKSKRQAATSAGEEPRLTPGSQENASLTTWGRVLSNTLSEAQVHIDLSTKLISECSQTHTNTAKDIRGAVKRTLATWASTLERADEIDEGLRRSRDKYYHKVQNVEAARQKSEKSSSTGDSNRQKALQNAKDDMANAKNRYILNIEIANAVRAQVQIDFEGRVLDYFQVLDCARVNSMNLCTERYSQLLSETASSIENLAVDTKTASSSNTPTLDALFFLQHNTNIGQWQPKAQHQFLPSPIWHEEATFSTESQGARVYLANILAKAKSSIDSLPGRKADLELPSLNDTNCRNVNLSDLIYGSRRDMTQGNGVPGMHNSTREKQMEEEMAIEVQRTWHMTEELQIERNCQPSELSILGKAHNFKATSFAIPTRCCYCKHKIWGLTHQGFVCRACNYVCHTKCELKVAPDCGSGNNTKVKQDSNSTVADSESLNKRRDYALPTSMISSDDDAADADSESIGLSSDEEYMPSMALSSHRQPKVSEGSNIYHQDNSSLGAIYDQVQSVLPFSTPTRQTQNNIQARALYSFSKTHDNEVDINVNDILTVMKRDYAPGWTLVQTKTRSSGIVPTTYLEFIENALSPEKPLNEEGDRKGLESLLRSLNTKGSGNQSPTASIDSSNKKERPSVPPPRHGRSGSKPFDSIPKKTITALYDFSASNPEEMSFKKGDKVIVLRELSPDWAEAQLNNRTGRVPLNYFSSN